MQATVLSPREVITEVEVQRPPLARRASDVSHLDYETRRQSVHNFGDLVMKLVRNNRARSKPREMPGKWMPHSHPVRKIIAIPFT